MHSATKKIPNIFIGVYFRRHKLNEEGSIAYDAPEISTDGDVAQMIICPIPKATQLTTLDDDFIYAGNPFLCGPPLANECFLDDSQHGLEVEEQNENGNEDKLEKIWFYFVIAIGYAIGFWVVIGSLFMSRSWRHAHCQCIDEMVTLLRQ
ncbi:uncharacterized protein HKW66_Vig0185480 [Vigna angularis]|uniref:Uncharacterized protein n=1 Tax=Phaseolus angularis TaxID=3914 RepID=A0A8T0KVS6_PHAAN|nr:uncharacterized protein HKW66_Vig0185480 [Vigna angularis]